MDYFRPLAQIDAAPAPGALPLAGGWCWFDRVEVLTRGRAPRQMPAADLPAEIRDRLCARRAPIAGLAMDRPHLMGIVNVTPDSFSDGGRLTSLEAALAHARALVDAGATMLDIGGESTRPGAAEVPVDQEIDRIRPLIGTLMAEGVAQPISIDTRKAAVARAALETGAVLVNDVSGFTFDPPIATVTAEAEAFVCLMHSRGTPQTMQQDTGYDDVLLDVYDWLAERIAVAEAAGIPRHRIVVDPGIGFAKTQDQNLALLRGLSLFHGLGCPILLGVSRKRFIGEIGRAPDPAGRAPGSIAAALAGVAQGVQILRVHDVAETDQALRLWSAITREDYGQ